MSKTELTETKNSGPIVVFSGDLTDTSFPDIDTMRMAQDLVYSIIRRGINIVYVVGNHEPTTDSWCSIINTAIKSLDESSTHGRCIKLSELPDGYEFGGKRLVGIDSCKSKTSFEEALYDRTSQGEFDILVIHQGYGPLMHSRAAHECDAETFRGLPGSCRLILAGHVHSQSSANINLDAGSTCKFVYSGSTYPCKTSESSHGWVEVDVNCMSTSYEQHNLTRVRASMVFEEGQGLGSYQLFLSGVDKSVTGLSDVIENTIGEVKAGAVADILFKNKCEIMKPLISVSYDVNSPVRLEQHIYSVLAA